MLLKKAIEKERLQDEKEMAKANEKREIAKKMMSSMRSGEYMEGSSTFSPMSKDYDFKTLSTQASPLID